MKSTKHNAMLHGLETNEILDNKDNKTVLNKGNLYTKETKKLVTGF